MKRTESGAGRDQDGSEAGRERSGTGTDRDNRDLKITAADNGDLKTTAADKGMSSQNKVFDSGDSIELRNCYHNGATTMCDRRLA